MIRSSLIKFSLYAILLIIVMKIYPHAYTTLQKINYSLGKIDTYSRYEYEEKVYGHMNFDFIRSVTKKLNTNTLPFLIYPNLNGDLYGVAMLLDGYRIEVNKDIIMILDLDKPLWGDDYDKCKKKIVNNNLIQECQLPDNYTITGVQFSYMIDDYSHIISYECKNKIIAKYNFDKEDLIHSKNIEYDNLLKIPGKDKFFKTINKNDCDSNIKITVSNIEDQNLNLSITGVGGEERYDRYFPPYIPEHNIIFWDKKDARNYLAISKTNFNKILDENKAIENFFKN